MIIVYEAKSSIDANIVQDILSMENINSHIMGGYLEGGIGEIQTMGVIKLMVEEQDFEQAKVLIHDWENQRIDTDFDQQNDHSATEKLNETTGKSSESEERLRHQTASLLVPIIVLIVVAVLLMWYFLLPQ